MNPPNNHTAAAANSSIASRWSRRTALRTMTVSGALAACPALLGFAPSSTRAPSASTFDPVAGALIMVIRHGEKPDKTRASVAGIGLSGRADPHSLTLRGWTRADYLVGLFIGSNPALPSPRVIYASGQGSGNGEGTRPRETVGPLAAALDIPVNDTFSRGQETALAAHAARQSGPVLICWQHQSIPAIAAALGPTTPAAPVVWPDDRYDVVWTFTATDMSAGWSFDQVPELLLAGDSPTGLN